MVFRLLSRVETKRAFGRVPCDAIEERGQALRLRHGGLDGLVDDLAAARFDRQTSLAFR